METPSSSARRVTRSQTLAAVNNTATNNNIPISRKTEDSDKGLTKSRRRNVKQQQDRSVLIDITNDSPIVGLAAGNLETPSSAIAKQRTSRTKISSTPGSGEALLRGQVKSLLQKVEEEAELSKLSLENRPLIRLQGFVSSPMGLLAPTPANTPQVPNLNVEGNDGDLALVTPLPVVQEPLKICQVVANDTNDTKQESLESQKSLTRSLMLDFSEKFETSDSSESSSVLTCEGDGEVASSAYSRDKSLPTDDDKASVWSIQANASTKDEEDDEEIFEGEEADEEYYEEEEEYDEDYDDGDDNGGLIDELCEGIGKISVKETATAQFNGKHTRFVYNSDDEIVDEELCSARLSPSVLHLKGLPTPKGKHLRFPLDEEDEE